MSARRVYLFDIDGTLLNAGGVGSAAFRHAARQVLGRDLDWRGRDFAGQTDAGLFRRALAEAKRAHDDRLAGELRELYHDVLAKNLQLQPAGLLPGAERLLSTLKAEPDSVVGLLTGNTRRGSELKLGGLFTGFALGFYGDTFTERTTLGKAARDQLDREFGEVHITVIGDTPNDIACARAAGAECVAVATGHYSREELTAADRVLGDLTQW